MEQNHNPHRDSTARQYPIAESAAAGQFGKVAEPVAAYVNTSSHTLTPTRRFIAGIPAAESVWRFAVTNELISHLETAVHLVQETFHHAEEVRITYDIDPEIENESWITLWVKVRGPMDDLLNEQAAYRKGMRQAVPINKLPLIRLFRGSRIGK